jgi:hypothetical protein
MVVKSGSRWRQPNHAVRPGASKSYNNQISSQEVLFDPHDFKSCHLNSNHILLPSLSNTLFSKKHRAEPLR